MDRSYRAYISGVDELYQAAHGHHLRFGTRTPAAHLLLSVVTHKPALISPS